MICCPRNVLPAVGQAIEKVVNTFVGEDSDVTIGILPHRGNAEFFHGFRELGGKCSYFITTQASRRDITSAAIPWDGMRSDIRAAFQRRCIRKSLDLPNILNGIKEIVKRAPAAPVSEGRCLRAATAWMIYADLLKPFSHGGKYDLTNAFLAPVRMLCTSKRYKEVAELMQTPDTTTNIKEFELHVQRRLEQLDSFDTYGGLGREIREAWRDIERLRKAPDDANGAFADALDTLMSLLTECRVLAGARTESSPRDSNISPPVPVRALPREPNHGQLHGYRVLVVDDHAAVWRSVFNVVAEELADRMKEPVCLEFSCNGENVCTEQTAEESVGRVIADYDVILLDIYLPPKDDQRLRSEKLGLFLLKHIRERLHGLPVVMWTTSVARELSKDATLANGFLFKKSATISSIVDTLAECLVMGRARRRVSLPNPFFDHVIKTPQLRDCALAFTNWCLKYLDSFHALDSSYFKFFNDHGGRHIVNLLGILEKLIRPILCEDSGLLTPSSMRVPVFSEEPGVREREFLCLYVAVLCHELGMFPMSSERTPNDSFQFHTSETLNLIRKQHGIRSLRSVMDRGYQSPEFQALIKMLKEVLQEKATPGNSFGVDYYVATLALLVGYHSRFLNLSQLGFCSLDSEKRVMMESEMKRHGPVTVEPSELARHLENAKASIPEHSVDRIRRLCAILRLADALDVDHTRVPADFILYHHARSARDDSENLKRLVVLHVEIDRGEILIQFNAKTPTPSFLRALGLNPAIPVADLFLNKSEDPATKQVEDACKNRVLTYFEKPPEERHEPEEDIRSCACLNVLLEIREEYQAIRDTDLSNHMRLVPPEWKSPTQNLPLLAEQTPGTFQIALTAESPEWKFNREEEAAIARAFQELTVEDLRKYGAGNSDICLHVTRIEGGRSGSKTCIVEMKPYTPRFCKVDAYERIDAEFKGLTQLAALHFNPRNLIGDVRIAKYRNYGVLLGSYLVEGQSKSKLGTLEAHMESNLAGNPFSAVESLFSNVLVFPFCGTDSLSTVYKRLFAEIPAAVDRLVTAQDRLEAKDREVFMGITAAGIDLNDLRQIWHTFENSCRGQSVCRSFVHGDVQPRNVLMFPDIQGAGQFVMIDTIYSGYGHALEDLAMFAAYLDTHVKGHLLKTSIYQEAFVEERLRKIGKTAQEILMARYVANNQDFAREYQLARTVRLFRVLTSWSMEPYGEYRNALIADTYAALKETLEELGVLHA